MWNNIGKLSVAICAIGIGALVVVATVATGGVALGIIGAAAAVGGGGLAYVAYKKNEVNREMKKVDTIIEKKIK